MNNIITENEKSSPSPLKEGGKTGTPPTPEAIKTNPNQDNPNPYFRRYGSHVKSHFSQSRCEFFESSDDDQERTKPKENNNNVNSLGHINDIKQESKGNQSTNNIGTETGKDSLEKSKKKFLTVQGTLGRSPSIDSGVSAEKEEESIPTIKINEENIPETGFQRKDSLEMELDEMEDDEEDKKSALIIKSRRDSISEDSFEKQGEQEAPKAQFINKFFQNGKVVESEQPGNSEKQK